MNAHHDFVILGSGSTAFAAALKGAEMGARVLMVEQSHLGGTCVNWGCIPSKTLIHEADEYYSAVRTKPYGVNLTAGPIECPLLMTAKKKAVEKVRREHYQAVIDDEPRIEVQRGHGRFISPHELQVGADVVVAGKFLIAVGGVPRTLRLPGITEVDYLTSYSAMHLPCFPESMVIIGGGVIALEMGQMFQRFGTRVTILERGERPLKDFDPRLTEILRQCLENEGLNMEFGVETQRVFRDGEDSCIVARVGGTEREFRAERIMFAIGTAPATADIGLIEAGVRTGAAGFIQVDEEMRTTTANIWAAGDVTGPPLIAPAGEREGEVAAENMLNSEAHRRIDHRQTPMGVFVHPELANVGLSTAAAEAEGKEVVETFFDLDRVPKAHVMGGRRGGIVLTAERGSGRILGVQMLMPRAADIIHEAAMAVKFGLSVFDMVDLVHVYPTISDGLRQAMSENVRQQKQLEDKLATTRFSGKAD